LVKVATGPLNGAPAMAVMLMPVAESWASSKAPMSTAGPLMRAKPRWSVLGNAAAILSPASIAGLLGSRAMVCVGPP
jgi:hypothetical protein